MNENMPIRIDKQDIIFQPEPYFSVEKGRRRKRKHKGLLWKLFTLIVLCIFTYFFATKFTEIKNFVLKNLDILYSDNDNNSNESSDEASNKNDLNDELNNVLSFNFIDTCPTKLENSNELDCEIFYEDSYVFSKSKELYEKYSYDAPIVLIVNFSPMEAYCDNGSFYNEKSNVCTLAKTMCDKLNQNGINSLHLYDTSSSSLYEGKDIFEQRIKDTLSMYPSISYIFDVSRAVHVIDDKTIYNEYVEYNNKKIPTIQISCGSSNGTITKEQTKSLTFANKLAEQINVEEIPLISKINISKYSLSQVFPCTTLRVDIGSFASKYEDALSCADIFTEGIIDFLSN